MGNLVDPEGFFLGEIDQIFKAQVKDPLQNIDTHAKTYFGKT